jgi:hypothetical protein
MIKRREIGQAFALVLIILAVGALVTVPLLRLVGTSLISSKIATNQVKQTYAVDGATEYVLWKLVYDAYGGEFTENGQTGYLQFDCCGIPVDITIVMRAIPGEGGIILATDDVIQPLKTVTPDSHAYGQQTYTYTIRLEQLSSNNTQGLDVIYDILPKDFLESDYVAGSSYLSVDGGAWEPIADPLVEVDQNQVRLRWPASGNFSSPIRDFEVSQVKELKFQVTGTLSNNNVHCNWVVLKPWNTVSGPQAPIDVGSPADPGICSEDGLIAVNKISDPETIPPNVETDIQYTIQLTNQDGFTHQVEEVTDYLPPDFYYIGPTSGATNDDPVEEMVNINDVDRWKLYWDLEPDLSLSSGETMEIVFWARAIKDTSGSYFNELTVLSDVPVPQIFQNIGVTGDDYYNVYSWTTGSVTVPAYDSSSEAGQIVLDANMSMILGGVTITSYHMR